MPEEKRFFVEISNIHFKIADELFEKGDIINSAVHIVEGMEINYDIKLDEKYKTILIEAGKKLTKEDPHKAILFFEFALRLVDETDFQKAEREKEEIKSYRKEAIKNLPLKERIIKIISDIYTGV
jgi:predicted O-methyltransferase YrrM